MFSLFGLLSVLAICGTLLVATLMVLLAMPQSHLRSVLNKGLFAVACAIYVISPIDLAPEVFLGPLGFIDDIGAVVLGLKSLKEAVRWSAK